MIEEKYIKKGNILFILPQEKNHLGHYYIILTDIDEEGYFIHVPITSYTEEKDQTTILKKEDIGVLIKKSIVLYREAKKQSISEFMKHKNIIHNTHRPNTKKFQPCSPKVLKRITSGISKSNETPEVIKNYMEEKFPNVHR